MFLKWFCSINLIKILDVDNEEKIIIPLNLLSDEPDKNLVIMFIYLMKKLKFLKSFDNIFLAKYLDQRTEWSGIQTYIKTFMCNSV